MKLTSQLEYSDYKKPLSVKKKKLTGVCFIHLSFSVTVLTSGRLSKSLLTGPKCFTKMISRSKTKSTFSGPQPWRGMVQSAIKNSKIRTATWLVDRAKDQEKRGNFDLNEVFYFACKFMRDTVDQEDHKNLLESFLEKIHSDEIRLTGLKKAVAGANLKTIDYLLERVSSLDQEKGISSRKLREARADRAVHPWCRSSRQSWPAWRITQPQPAPRSTGQFLSS